MINTKLLTIFEKHNIPISKGLAYLFSLYYNEKDTTWIDKDIVATIQILGIVKIVDGLPTFKIPIFEQKQLKPFTRAISKTDIEDFVKTKYIPLWPTRKDTGLTYDVSGNTNACIDRMTKFINDFNKTFDKTLELSEIMSLIHMATEMYIAVRRVNNYAYTKKNVKFIYDEQGSELENTIRRILTGTTDEIENLHSFNKEIS